MHDRNESRGRALVAGAGIGGLVAALTLHRAGYDVRLLEAAREIRALGVGINLQPHAVLVLHELGLLDALRATAIETAALVYVNKFGQRIWEEPRGLAAGYPVPQLSILRGDLQMILYRAVVHALGPDAIRCGASVSRYEQDDRGVTAYLVDREAGAAETSERGDFLVGADGIHSTVRKQANPDEGPARFSGCMLWRAMTEAEPFFDGRTMVWSGHADQKFVCYPVSASAARAGRSMINWIAELRVRSADDPDRTPPRTDWNRRVDAGVFAEPFADWNFGWLDIPGLIAKAGEAYEFPMVDRDPLDRWTIGRVTLLGDAAHAMYPIGSNGASQAILDARELADQLVAHAAVEPALTAYDAIRRPITAAIVAANRRQGPDEVMLIAEQRAPRGFGHIHEVIGQDELVAIAAKYKQTAGFDQASVERAARANRETRTR